MANDLENSLIDGGIAPAAAKLIANAIANAATGKLTLGPQLADATPAKKMRLIDSDTRRYVLTNLDHTADQTFSDRLARPGKYNPRDRRHPYDGSQPASASPTLSTPTVAAGKYVAVSSGASNDVAQSQVTLNIRKRGGTHARMNEATGVVEAVPFLVEVEPKDSLEASVEERPDATVIRIRLKT
jgi:hypothetical protein